ncbi:MAG: protein-glutamate O-methyltransferase [Proteobacteria bacterium]|nr:protein-glutamate O-methyltransferase [Pseudomonadota bacterium]
MNASTGAISVGGEFDFSERDFKRLAGLLHSRTRIILGDNKRALVYSRLARRLRENRLTTFSAYLDLISSPAGAEELERALDAITTNLTKFFREDHHFDHLRKEVLPRVNGAACKRLRIWSAGCSSGQEPFSIAMTIAETVPDFANRDIRILATDLDSKMVAKGATGQYSDREVESIPAPLRKKYLQGPDASGMFVFDRKLKSLIAFRNLNFFHDWPFRGPFDAIFCRNVFIYFESDDQRAILDRMSGMLADDGFLYMGHSENLSRITDQFAACGRTTYRKARA